MKYLVLSDIHGGSAELQQALSFYDKFNADFIVLLGDLLNHGPRNPLPASYEPPKVTDILNGYADVILSVRGNCDGEVDSMLFSFPCNAPYSYLILRGEGYVRKAMLTHGHLHDFKSREGRAKLGLKDGDLVLSGHTHVSGIFPYEGVLNINPGSTTLPKGGTAKGFMFIDEEMALLTLHDLEGSRIKALNLKDLSITD